MKHALVIIAFILPLACLSQVYTSHCVPSGNMESVYKVDAYRLAMARVFEINSPFKDSVEIPSIFSDTIAKALYAIHNMAASPLKDTIMNLFGFSDFQPTDYEYDSSHVKWVTYNHNFYTPLVGASLKKLTVWVLNSAPWADDWVNGNYYNTSNADVNYLMNRYGLTVTPLIVISDAKLYTITVPVISNTTALAKKFEVIEGVKYAYSGSNGGDGNGISIIYEADGIRISFANGCGDCPAGCTRSTTWTFKVFTFSDCHVEYMGSVVTGSTHFSGDPFVCMRYSVVPVVFSSVNAYLKNYKPLIEWKVASETGIDKYIIERSFNGRQFTMAGTMAAKGNATNLLLYAWQDNLMLQGQYVYYRIYATDHHGNTKHTNVVKVRLKPLPGLFVYPNPVRDKKLQIQFGNWNAGNYIVTLFTKEGSKIFTNTITANTSLINLPETILPGTYIIVINTGKEQLKQLLVVL